MKLGELKQRLIEEHIREDSYAIGEKHADEAYSLESEDNSWFVYYSERGLKSSLREFDSESDACDFFYKWIRDDVTTRK